MIEYFASNGIAELVLNQAAGWKGSDLSFLSKLGNLKLFEIFDFNVYAMCSDGDLMEGIGGEAASLAGHLKLSNLCWIYDNNHVTLDGPANWSFSEDVATRFIATFSKFRYALPSALFDRTASFFSWK